MEAWIPAVAVLIIAFFNALFYTLNERSLFRRLGRCGSGTGDFTGGSGSGRAARRRCAPLLISNRRAGLPPGARPAGSWGWDILDPSHLYTPSFCRGRTPSACAGGCAAPASADGGGYCGGGGGGAVLALAAFRSLHVVVFVFAVAYGEAAYQGGGARGFFIYFTNWTYVLYGITGVLGTALTLLAWRGQLGTHTHAEPPPAAAGGAPAVPPPCCRRHKAAAAGRPQVHVSAVSSSDSGTGGGADERDAVQPCGACCCGGGWRAADKAYMLAMQAVTPASVALTLFFWVLLYKRGDFVRTDNPFKHGVSSFLLLMDFGLSRTPVVSSHISAVMAYGTVYLVFLWAWWGATGEWVYAALNWAHPASLGGYVALPLLLILAYAIMFGIAAARERAAFSSPRAAGGARGGAPAEAELATRAPRGGACDAA